jgi:hypothetical protein
LRLKRALEIILVHAYWVSRDAGIRGILDFGYLMWIDRRGESVKEARISLWIFSEVA